MLNWVKLVDFVKHVCSWRLMMPEKSIV